MCIYVYGILAPKWNVNSSYSLNHRGNVFISLPSFACIWHVQLRLGLCAQMAMLTFFYNDCIGDDPTVFGSVPKWRCCHFFDKAISPLSEITCSPATFWIDAILGTTPSLLHISARLKSISLFSIGLILVNLLSKTSFAGFWKFWIFTGDFTFSRVFSSDCFSGVKQTALLIHLLSAKSGWSNAFHFCLLSWQAKLHEYNKTIQNLLKWTK